MFNVLQHRLFLFALAIIKKILIRVLNCKMIREVVQSFFLNSVKSRLESDLPPQTKSFFLLVRLSKKPIVFEMVLRTIVVVSDPWRTFVTSLTFFVALTSCV